MSNLGEGLAEEREAIGYEKGFIKGFVKGFNEGFVKGFNEGFDKGYEEEMNRIILRMYKYHEPLEQIMSITGKSENEIKDILNKCNEE